MSKKVLYTDEQIKQFRENPYTHSVTPYMIKFTVEFKEFFIEQVKIPHMTTRKILAAAGYDASLFNNRQLSRLRARIFAQAESPEGFHTSGKSDWEKAREFAAKDLEKQRTETTLKEMQEQIAHLQEQIEFLKKISFMRNHPKKP